MSTTHQNLKESGNIIITAVLSVLLVLSLVFGGWAFVGMQDYKNNVNKKIDKAVEEQIEVTSAEKDAEYAEKDKSPVKTFSGSQTYGSVAVDYPKTWSVYLNADGSTPVNVFFGPNFVSADKGTLHALRIQVVESSYSQEVSKYDDDIKRGKLTSTAFRAEKVPDVLGVRLDGDITTDKKGSIILLPLRDKTIKIWTESELFIGDFNTFIVKSISFIP